MTRQAVRARRRREKRAARRATAVATLGLLLLALLLYGNPVPRLSEELYLPLVRHTGDHGYLAGDWTLAGPFGEHWIFDHLFGPLAATVSITWFGWVGRLLTWTGLAYLLIRLGRRYELGSSAAAAAVALWIVGNQALFGSDWMFGTFEAKTVADLLVVGALLAATSDRIPLAMILVGTATSFHPGLGGWAAFATVAALLANPRTRRDAARSLPLAVLFAAPGLIALVRTLSATPNHLLRFLVVDALPYHLDPFFGGVRMPGAQVALRAGALAAMLAANIAWYRRSDRSPARQFLVGIQVMAVIPAVVAFIARALESWQFLVLQPLRFGPLLIPLLFWYQLVERVIELRLREDDRAWWRRRSTVLAGGAVVIALAVTSPVLAAPRLAVRNVRSWTRADPEADAFRWIRAHTPTTTRCVVPVDRQDAFALGERPIVGNWQAIRYDDVAGWKHRVDALVGGGATFPDGAVDLPFVRAAYDRLTELQMLSLARRFDADCIVATTRYPLPVLHRVGPVRIYRVPGAAGP
jgi:hypothetical protein